MSTQKEESALRIMEALSGVDEDLLERCGQPGTLDTQEKKAANVSGIVYGFMRKYGGICAACLCLAVLGTAWWKISQPKGGFDNTAESVRQEDVQEDAPGAYECEIAGEEGTEAPQESLAGEMKTEDISAAAANTVEETVEPEWLDMSKLAAEESWDGSREEADGTSNQQMCEAGASPESLEEAAQNHSGKMELASVIREISWEEAYAVSVLGQYVPVELPAGYLPLTVKQASEAEGGNSLVLTWSDGEHTLWLKLTETELNTGVNYSADVPILKADGDWQSQIPVQADDGSIRFALLYEDGVLAEYKGWLTTDEIGKLFCYADS